MIFVHTPHLIVFILFIIFMNPYEVGRLIGLTDKDLSIIGYAPRLNEYREDFIFGLIWRWDRFFENFPDSSIWCRCPTCLTRLTPNLRTISVSGRGVLYTEFYCPTHNAIVEVLPGRVGDILPRVKRQIERKINTGEWKDVVRRSKAGNLVPKEGSPNN